MSHQPKARYSYPCADTNCTVMDVALFQDFTLQDSGLKKQLEHGEDRAHEARLYAQLLFDLCPLAPRCHHFVAIISDAFLSCCPGHAVNLLSRCLIAQIIKNIFIKLNIAISSHASPLLLALCPDIKIVDNPLPLLRHFSWPCFGLLSSLLSRCFKFSSSKCFNRGSIL